MRKFDDDLPQRRFDNFQFVPFYETITNKIDPSIAFAVAALQEIPAQYCAIRNLGLLWL